MKSLLHLGATILFAAATAQSLRAQLPTLTVNDARYTATRLFNSTPGYTISGMAADEAGNVYYIESDTVSFSANSILYKRSAIGGYTMATPLCDLGSGVFGTFVIYSGGKLYFGESSTDTIRSIKADGTGVVDVLGTVPFNYDAALVGNSLFISNNPGGFDTASGNVSKFDLVAETGGDGGLMLGPADIIINAAGDSGGALEYSQGELYYGARGYNSVKGIYRFTTTEVETAFGTSALTLDQAHKFGATTTNNVGALALGNGTDLWKDDQSSTSLLLFDRYNGGVSIAPLLARFRTASNSAISISLETYFL